MTPHNNTLSSYLHTNNSIRSPANIVRGLMDTKNSNNTVFSMLNAAASNFQASSQSSNLTPKANLLQ